MWFAGALETVERVYLRREGDDPWVELSHGGSLNRQPWPFLLDAGAVPLPRVGEWWQHKTHNHPHRVIGVDNASMTVFLRQPESTCSVHSSASFDRWPGDWLPVAVRVQCHRLAGYRLPPGARRCCRPGAWGNPFCVGVDGDAAACVASHRMMLDRDDAEPALAWQRAHLGDLRGLALACACRLDAPCHVDTLIEMANQPGAAH